MRRSLALPLLLGLALPLAAQERRAEPVLVPRTSFEGRALELDFPAGGVGGPHVLLRDRMPRSPGVRLGVPVLTGALAAPAPAERAPLQGAEGQVEKALRGREVPGAAILKTDAGRGTRHGAGERKPPPRQGKGRVAKTGEFRYLYLQMLDPRLGSGRRLCRSRS